MNRVYKTMIIEDEKLARTRLKMLLRHHEDCINIIAEAENGLEGLKYIEEKKPDLIFLDIQMPGLNGFEMLKKLNHMPIVIFTTSFDEFAIKAFEQNAIDYLLKPIEVERLEMTMQKLERLNKSNLMANTIQFLELMDRISQKKEITSIPVKIGDTIFPVRLEEIIYIEAKDKYTFIHNHSGKEFLIDFTLSALEEKLPEQFVRVHRAFILNKEKIKEVRKYFNSKYTLIMNDEQHSKIVSGSSYSDRVKSIFEI